METTNTTRSFAGVTDISKSECILKLERNTLDLEQLESKMSSYVCEPNTHQLFDRCQSIRQNLERLKNRNRDLIQEVKKQKDLQIENLENTIGQLRDFTELWHSVQEYQKQLR